MRIQARRDLFPASGKAVFGLVFLYATVSTFSQLNTKITLRDVMIIFTLNASLPLAYIFFSQLLRSSHFFNLSGENKQLQLKIVFFLSGLLASLTSWFLSKDLIFFSSNYQRLDSLVQISGLWIGHVVVTRFTLGIAHLQRLQIWANKIALDDSIEFKSESSAAQSRRVEISSEVSEIFHTIYTSSLYSLDSKVKKVRDLSVTLYSSSRDASLRAKKIRKRKLFKRSRLKLLWNSAILFTVVGVENSISSSIVFLYFSQKMLLSWHTSVFFAIIFLVLNTIALSFLQRIIFCESKKKKLFFLLIFLALYPVNYLVFSLIQGSLLQFDLSVSSEKLLRVFVINLCILTCYKFFIAVAGLSILTIEDVQALKFEVIQKTHATQYRTALNDSRSLALISRRVHGPLQSLLVQNLTDPLSAHPLSMTEIHRLLNVIHNEDFPLESFEYAATEILFPWKGLIDIELEVNIARSQQLRSIPSDKIEDVLSVIEDAVLNAYRHGKSTFVKVDLTIDGSGWVSVFISNNGASYSGESSGLGFDNFYRVFGEKWNLRNEGCYVVFRGSTCI